MFFLALIIPYAARICLLLNKFRVVKWSLVISWTDSNYLIAGVIIAAVERVAPTEFDALMDRLEEVSSELRAINKRVLSLQISEQQEILFMG